MGILLPHVNNRLTVGLHKPDDELETLRLPKRTRRGIQPGQVHKCKSSLKDLILPELDLPELCVPISVLDDVGIALVRFFLFLIYSFIFGCAGLSLLHGVFSS